MNTRAQVKGKSNSSSTSFTPVQYGLLQRKCACGGSSGLASECEGCQKKRLTGQSRSLLQRNLAMSEPGDQYEQEADRAASEIQRQPAPEEEEEIQTKPANQIQRQEEEEELTMKRASEVQRQEEELIHHKEAAIQDGVVSQAVEAQINMARGGGQPLAETVRASFEPQFEHDFSSVRLHTDAEANKLSRQLGATAFTTGRDIFFREGAYNPNTDRGKGLIAHELTHVVQQSKASPVPVTRVTKPLEISEIEAEAVAREFICGKGISLVPRSGMAGVVARRDGEEGRVETAEGPTPGAPPEPQAITLRAAEVRLRALREYPIHVTNPVVMNQAAINLLGHLRTAATQSTDLCHDLGYLEYAERTGESDLGAVQAARAALGAGARGPTGEYLRRVIEIYAEAHANVRIQVSKIQGTQHRIVEATKQLHEAVLGRREREAKREVEASEEELANIEERVANANRVAEGVIKASVEALTGQWVKAGINLAEFVGTGVVAAGIEAAYAPELARAQDQLREAKANLGSIQDEKDIATVEKALAKLGAANADADTDQMKLIELARRAKLRYVTLSEAMRDMGYKRVEDALHARASVMRVADDTLPKLAQYEETVTTVQEKSTQLENLNRHLADLMLSSGGAKIVSNEEHRWEMYDVASSNATVLESVRAWSENELLLIEQARAYVEGGAYRSDYDAIDRALHDALYFR